MADALLALFDRWGYERLVTPMFELAEVFERGLGADARAATIRFVEPGTGDVVALRPDITPQIARIAATHPLTRHGPARLCYEGTVSRDSRRPGGARDQVQAGIELIGLPGAEGDVEAACIAAEALGACGVSSYRLELGHVALVRTVLGGVPTHKRPDLEKALAEKNQSGIGLIAKELDPRLRALCNALPLLVGRADQVFARVQALGLDAGVKAELDAFAETVKRVGELTGLGARLSIDLGEVRGFHYYTGMRLFGYVAGVGHAVLRGGRYDDLIGQYGPPAVATGFAVDIEAIADAQAKAGVPSTWAPKGALLVCSRSQWVEAQKVAVLLRATGQRVATAIDADIQNDAAVYAKDAGFARVVTVDEALIRAAGNTKELTRLVFGGNNA